MPLLLVSATMVFPGVTESACEERACEDEFDGVNLVLYRPGVPATYNDFAKEEFSNDISGMLINKYG